MPSAFLYIHASVLGHQLVVTGVTNRSPAYQHLKDGNLKLLSMVTSVCGTDVGELTESFDDNVLPMASVELGLDMSRALSVDHFPGRRITYVGACCYTCICLPVK